ncbi:MAG: AI-2E family transporter [Treponema sp.]|nr:AI-2E family transporter [Treponema sp.]
MTNLLNKGKFKTLFPYFLFAVAIIASYAIITEISFVANFLSRVWTLITPIFYGFLIAYIVNMPYGGLKRLFGKSKIKFFKKTKKLFSAILTIIFFILIIFAVLYLFIPHIITSISFFIAQLPSYIDGVRHAIDYVNDLGFFGIYISTEVILSTLNDIFQNLNLEYLPSVMGTVFGEVSSALFTGVLALITSIYIMIEKEKFKSFLRRLLTAFLSVNVCKAFYEYTGRLNRNFKRYIRVQTIDGCILGTLVIIQLLIMRSPYALVLGIMLGIVNYIPYFGSIFGTIVVIIIVAFTQGLGIAAIAAVLLLITQQIDGNIIQPKLMGGSFSLSPLLVIISIIFGGAIAGVLGMIAAIPIIAVLKDILGNIIAYYERKKNIAPPPEGNNNAN